MRKFGVVIACVFVLIGGGAVQASGSSASVPFGDGQWPTPNGVLAAEVTDSHVAVTYYRKSASSVDVAVGYEDTSGDHRTGFVRLQQGQQHAGTWERDALRADCATVYAQFRNDREEHVLCP